MSEHSTSDIQHSTFLLCPGQGAQHVGMGKAWADAQAIAAETFANADEILGMGLSKLCFDGPAEALNRTDIAQPAIYVTSVACYRALEKTGELGAVSAAGGLSLGEFTALHLAGAFSFEEGLRLVRLRGQAMQGAAQASHGSMVAISAREPIDEAAINDLCDRARGDEPGSVLVSANFNSPMQVVVSGTKDACERAVTVGTEMGFKTTPLAVAGAFHSPLMQPAADRLAKALDEVHWNLPEVPVLSNVTGKLHDNTNIDSIKQGLVEQLMHPVRWAECMRYAVSQMPGGAPVRFVELAPDKVLAGLMRRIDRQVKVENHAEPG